MEIRDTMGLLVSARKNYGITVSNMTWTAIALLQSKSLCTGRHVGSLPENKSFFNWSTLIMALEETNNKP